jgi:nitrite reductase/ring-hydroxylating ferredoxin subunit
MMPLVDLEENKPTRATAEGEDLVLVRHGDTVHALANTCAHLGAPLSDGKVDGESIVCPWHGSTFSLEDGSVQCGPSAYNQPCYLTRVRNGIVEVKLANEYGEREPFYRVTSTTETAYGSRE